MSGDGTSDEEGSQEDSARYDIDDLEIIKTIGELLVFILFDSSLFNLILFTTRWDTFFHEIHTRWQVNKY